MAPREVDAPGVDRDVQGSVGYLLSRVRSRRCRIVEQHHEPVDESAEVLDPVPESLLLAS